MKNGLETSQREQGVNDDGRKQDVSNLHPAKESDITPKGLVEAGSLLFASLIAFALGFVFLFADERMLASPLNHFFGANATSAPAIGLVFFGTGA